MNTVFTCTSIDHVEQVCSHLMVSKQVPKQSSAYTIPKAARPLEATKPKEYTVGPGEYCTIAALPEGPAFTIPHSGAAARGADAAVSDTPAPGATAAEIGQDLHFSLFDAQKFYPTKMDCSKMPSHPLASQKGCFTLTRIRGK